MDQENYDGYSTEIQDDNNGFILVGPKKKYNKSHDSKYYTTLEKNNVIEESKKILIKYRPYAAYLYGSTARGRNKQSSDVDIFVIWKNKVPSNEIIKKIHNELYNTFNRRVDFVNYHYNGKSINISSADSCFIQNVLCDAVSILEPKNDLSGMALKEILFKFDCYLNDF